MKAGDEWRGGSLVVTVDAKLLLLEARDRALVDSLINLLDTYQRDNKPDGTAAALAE